jgi:hypothetical protein
MYAAAACFFVAAIIGLVTAYLEGASVTRSIATVALPVALGCVMLNVANRPARRG